MALKSYSAISGSNTKIRAEQIKSEESGLETLAGELFAIKGQIADIIGETSFMEQAPSNVQMLDLDKHLDASGATELIVKQDSAMSGSVHMLGTLDVDGEATLASATVEDLSADRLVASDSVKGLVSIDLVDWITGTANQVAVSGSAGEVVLSLPQNIHTAASPTFAGVTVTDLTPGRVVYVGASDELVDSSEMTFGAGGLTLAKDLSARSGSFSGDVVISGDLQVMGATTTVDTQNLLVKDAKIVISSGGIVDGAGIYLADDSSGENIRWATADGGKWIASDKFAADTMQALDLSSAIVWADADGNLVEISDADFGGKIKDRLVEGTGVHISEAAGDITIAIGQAVETTSSVTFAAVTGSNLTASRLMASNGDKAMVSADLADWVTGTANQINVTGAAGAITLSLPQDIATGSSPSFADLSLSGELAFGSAGSLSFSGDDLIISGTVGELYFADENAVPGGWSNALGIKLSDSAAEWTNFESAFGEVSLLAAIYQAGSATNAVNKYVKAILAPGVAADAATAIGGGLDFAVVGDAAKKVDVFLNGQMMVSGSSSDYVIGGTDNVTFKFALEAGDVVAVVVR